jgi:phytoene dehydrogenase-like protein
VDIRTDSPVAEVVVEKGRATKVVTDKGEVFEGKAVVSNLNPKLLFGSLVDEAHQPADFRERMARYRCGSGDCGGAAQPEGSAGPSLLFAGAGAGGRAVSL